MKKLIFLLLIIGTMVTKSNAQNFLGFSFYDIRDEMNLKGYSINVDRTENGYKCLTATTHNQMRLYFFDDNNNCIRYVYSIEGATYKILEDALRSNDYTKYSDGSFYTSQYKADIVYLDQYKNWFVVTDKRK
jgi:hypothetical protein